MTRDALGRLREEIAEIDRALLELIRRRMDLAARVGELKAAAGTEVVVRDVEARILERAREHAARCGVSEGVMERIFAGVIGASVERQHRVGIDARRASGGRVLIVGGAGGMGRWFRAFFELVGHRPVTVDPAFASLPPEETAFARLEEAGELDRFEGILVAVPLEVSAAVVDEIVAAGPRVPVVEIASIKAPLAASYARARKRGVPLVALHPMFGPGKSPYEPLTFVLAVQRDAAAERESVARLLRHPYTQIVTLPLAEHDRLMGWLLGLAHLSGMIFGSALARSGLSPSLLAECASTTFERQAATARSILSEDPNLYLDIQRLNPHRDEVYRATREALEELVALVAAGERERFADVLEEARRVVQP